MYDSKHFTRDAATVRFDDDAAGITRDGDEVQFDWDSVETVTIDDVPHATAFDTKQFYKLPATVARPIRQPYQFNDETVWLKKPREELKSAAWSLDNSPWTLGHPDTGMVKSVDDIRGFWKDPRYIDGLDDLDADLHVPVDDEEARAFIEDNGDVSVGFYNQIARTDEYDGVVGGTDSEGDIDGYQTDMYFDHVASVAVGRCPSGKGCGIDSRPHGHVTDAFKGTNITQSSDDTGDTMVTGLDQSEHTHEGSWYAVPPDDNPDDEWKFPIDNCSDVSDAWQLRHHGDISIEVSTLANRIQERARDLGCDVPESSDSEDSVTGTVAADYDITTTDTNEMTDDCNCDNGGFDLQVDDLSAEVALEKMAAEHDGIDEYLDTLERKAEVADEAADELDVEVEQVADAAATLDEENTDLRETVDELQEPQMEDAAEVIVERTDGIDRFGDTVDEVIENHDSLDELQETKALVEDLTSTTDEKTANAGGSDEESSLELDSRGYVNTPWADS